MKADEINKQAIYWLRGTIALVEDSVTPWGLRRRKFVSVDYQRPDRREHLSVMPADAEQVHVHETIDEHGHATLLITFKTPASRAGATRQYIPAPWEKEK